MSGPANSVVRHCPALQFQSTLIERLTICSTIFVRRNSANLAKDTVGGAIAGAFGMVLTNPDQLPK